MRIHANRRCAPAVNFVGGWIGEGCGDYREINRALFAESGSYAGTSIWLYGRNDSFYSIGYSRTNFDAFAAAGGVGEFHELQRAPGLNGYFLINDPGLWQPPMAAFVDSR